MPGGLPRRQNARCLFTRVAGMALDVQIQADVDRVRLRTHAVGSPLASGGSLLVAALLVWVAGASIAPPWLVAWLGLLALVVALRAWLPQAHRRAAPAVAWPDSAVPGADPALEHADRQRTHRRLWHYRLLILAHGVVWGAVAWLPASLADPGLQLPLTLVLVGMAIGATTLTLFDLPATLLFSVPLLLPLAFRLGAQADILPAGTVVAGVMAVLLLGMLALTGRRAERQRQALALLQRAERQSAEGTREAQALVNQVFAHAGQGISVFDRDLRLRAWNPQLFDSTGLDPTTVRAGMPLRDWLAGLMPPPERDAATELDRQLLAWSDPQPAASHTLRADGHRIETRRNPLPGGGFVMFHVDITERDASQAAAAEQQRKLSLVLETTEQGFWTIDNDQCTTDANPAMCRMLGLSRAQMMGRSIYEFVDADNRAVLEHQVRLRAAGQAEGYEIALTRADGSPVHCFNNATPVFDAAGHKIGALGLFSDISAQKRAEQQIRQAGELLAQKSHALEMTLDSLLQGVLNVDASGRCTAWNHRFIELLQFPPALMATRPTLEDLLNFQLAQGHFGRQLERLDEGGRRSVAMAQQGAPAMSGHRYRRTRVDGTVIDVASHFAADGSLVRTFTDVTASVAAEAALIAALAAAEQVREEAETAREEAESANRAKSEFLSRMSHELRTPLNAILGFGQLLQADVADPLSPGQRGQLDELLRGGRHLLALINDVLDVARIEAGNLQLTLQPVDLAALALDCLRLVQPVAQDRGVTLALQFEPPDAHWTVTADATRLKQVLLNLLSNAIKFNRAHGEVRVSGRAVADGLLLEVADQGPGIAADQVPRLFKAFERLDMAGTVEGTGIGLSLSRSLVALMHGEIGLRSVPGQGSVFWVRLPVGTEGVALADPPAAADPPAVAGRRHDVLYIEDNEVNQLLMQGMLAHRPAIGLRLALMPEQGLAMALAQPPDLVLLDIQLPGLDGFEVLRRLRAQPALRHTPVIAVSANAMPDDLAEARRAGFADYLTKPVDMPRLLALVDRVLNP